MSTAEEVVKGMDDAVVEVIDEAAETVNHLLISRRDYRLSLAIVGVASGVIGGSLAYYVCKRKMEAKYESIIEEEIQRAKVFYNSVSKTEQDLETLAEGLNEESSDEDGSSPADLNDVARALLRYQGGETSDDEDDQEEEEDEVETDQPDSVNVFMESRSDDDFDLDAEINNRTPDRPYVISSEEFLENESEFAQTTITYYIGDGTLADEKDQEIPLIDPTVGSTNLERFGHGSGDSRVVYVRNERLTTDFEVVLHDGKFAHEVLGLEHSAETSERMRNRRSPHKGGGDD